jgi:hypothetical protein
MEPIWIATIDPGKKNFAFIIQEIDFNSFNRINFVKKDDRYDDDGVHTKCFKNNLIEMVKISKVIEWQRIDITCETKKYFDNKILYELTSILDKFKPFWDKCRYIVIEEQMSFGAKHNTMAIKIAQHCQSYFIFNYFKFKEIIMFPSYHKTKVLGSLKGITKPQRKTWSVKLVTEFLEHILYSTQNDIYKKEKKKDDLSDCMLMVFAFLIKHFKK